MFSTDCQKAGRRGTEIISEDCSVDLFGDKLIMHVNHHRGCGTCFGAQMKLWN